MPRRKAKKQPEKEASKEEVNPIELEIQKRMQLIDQEVERQCGATRAMLNIEIEHSLTGLRLIRSYLSNEQLSMSVSEFFKKYLSDLSVVKDGENGEFDVDWNEKDDNLSTSQAFLRRLNAAYPGCSVGPSIPGFELSNNAGQTSMIGVDGQHTKDFVLEGPSESQMFADGLQTPGMQVSSQRMSIGMTPKTLRLPKPGEMLLSVRGSPLGVYKEENMEAIHESEEG